MNQDARPRTLFLAACGGILVFGIVLAILGTVFGLPEMRARLRIDLAQQGNLILLLYLGIFCASLVVGPLIDRAGNKIGLCISSLIVTVAMLMFAAAHSFAAACSAAGLLGLGGGGLNTCTNAMVSDLYGEQRGPMLNLLGIFFGIGALFVPLLAGSLEGHFTIAQLFIFCSALSAGCALTYGMIAFPAAGTNWFSSWRDIFGVARYESLLLLAFILFFESGNEACIGGWTSTFVNAIGHSSQSATLVLASYWAALMVSRILAARLLSTMRKSQLVLGAALISAAGCAILLFARSLSMLFTGTALIGLSYGPIFPTALAIAGDRYSKMAGTVFGFLFSVALLGGMALPWAVGEVSQRGSVHAGMIVPLIGATGITILTLALVLTERRRATLSETSGARL